MAHNFQSSPFVSLSGGERQLASVKDATTALDLLAQSPVGKLYCNRALSSLGLVCGASIQETAIIVRRLMASHMENTAARVLVLHTDHFSIKKTCCPLLLSPNWPSQTVVVSPQATSRILDLYRATGVSAIPMTIKDTSLTLGHVFSLFTPPPDMRQRTSILVAIELILSQMGDHFDLQRFIELVDQEKWSEEAASFVALRETLLTKLLSPTSECTARRVTIVDLTDPVLRSTGLDSSMMEVAIHEFIESPGAQKMIVFNNCQEYLRPTSSLMRTLEGLVTVGINREASIILSTTDPTILPFPILNSLDYVISGLFRSLLWNTFMHQHLTRYNIPKSDSKSGRAMIWSPESAMLRLNTSDQGTPKQKRWEDRLSFVDIQEFERSMPLTKHTTDPLKDNEVHGGTSKGKEKEETVTDNRWTRQEMTPADTNQDAYGDDEEGIISLQRMDKGDQDDLVSEGQPSTFKPAGFSNGESSKAGTHLANERGSTSQPTTIRLSLPTTKPRPFDAASSIPDDGNATERLARSNTTTVDTQATSPRSRCIPPINIGLTVTRSSVHSTPLQGSSQGQPKTLDVLHFAFKHRAVVSIMIQLTNGIPGRKVRMEVLRTAFKLEYRGAREDFLYSLIVDAHAELVLHREMDEAGVFWVSLRSPSASSSTQTPKGKP